MATFNLNFNNTGPGPPARPVGASDSEAQGSRVPQMVNNRIHPGSFTFTLLDKK